MILKCHRSPLEYQDRYEPCALMGAAQTASGIRNTAVVMHAPLGCNTTAVHLRSDMVPDGDYVPIVATGLDPNDVVTGAKDILIRTLNDVIDMKMMKVEKSELIWVMTGCATSIIGDDIQGAAQQIERERGIKVIALDAPGFKGGFSVGAELVYNALLDNYLEPYDGKKEGLNLVGTNLMGSKNWINDVKEIKRLLEAADIKVHCTLAHATSIKEVRQMIKAKANYMLTSEEMPLFDKHCERVGLENWGRDLVLPMGVANTEEWYIKIAERFGNVDKAKRQMVEDMERIKRILKANYNASWMLSYVSSKQVGVIGFAPFAAALARYLFWDLNARPRVIALLANTQESIERAKILLEPLEPYLDFEIFENPSYYQYGKALKNAEVDFALGQRQDKVLTEGLGIPHHSLGGFYFWNQFNFVPFPYFGILGSLNLLSEISQVIEKAFYPDDVWKARTYLNREEKEKMGLCLKE